VAVFFGVKNTFGCLCWGDGYVWFCVLGRWLRLAVCVGMVDTCGCQFWCDGYVRLYVLL